MCNPNALTVAAGSLYVVCNSDFGGIDRILVYDANSRAFVKTIGGTDVNGADYFTGSSLTGILFDAKGSLNRKDARTILRRREVEFASPALQQRSRGGAWC